MADVEKQLRHMQHDMLKLNTLLFREKGAEEMIERDNILIESDFVLSLRVSGIKCFFLIEYICALSNKL